MARSGTTAGKSNTGVILAAVLGVVVYAVGTYVAVEAAGGTKIEPSYGNTPNGVTVGPPGFK
jgi:hypothetical protein